MIRSRGAGHPLLSLHSLHFSQSLIATFFILSIFQVLLVTGAPLRGSIKSVDQASSPPTIEDTDRLRHVRGQVIARSYGSEHKVTIITAVETIIKTVVDVETITTILRGGDSGEVATTKTCKTSDRAFSEIPSTKTEIPTDTTAINISTESPRPSRSRNPTSTEDLVPPTVTSKFLYPTDIPVENPPNLEDPSPPESSSGIPTSASGPMVSSILVPIGFGEVETSIVTSNSPSTKSIIRVSHVLSGGIISHTMNAVAPMATDDADSSPTGTNSPEITRAEVSQNTPTAVYTGAAHRMKTGIWTQTGTIIAMLIGLYVQF